MRILQIIPTLDRSGAEKQLTLLAAGLVQRGVDVQVCALTRGGPLADDLQAAGVPLTIIGKPHKFDPRAYWRLKQHIAQVKPDLVHTWLFAANSYGRVAARAAGVKHLVAGERCVDPWKAWHELAIDRYLARRSDCIVTNSSGVRDFYAQHRVPAEKFVVIPNGIGPARASRLSRAEFLATLGLPANARVIGAVARLWPQKRLKDLIWAADLLKAVRDDVHLVIVGDGPQRERLERYCEQVQITDKVHLLGHRNDVPDLLPHWDALWLSSEYEGLPNVVMEAMAAGIPVVATDISGNRDLVLHEQTGYLVPLGDRAGFARHTRRILDNPELGKQLGHAGQSRMLNEYSIEKMVTRHEELYRRLLAQQS